MGRIIFCLLILISCHHQDSIISSSNIIGGEEVSSSNPISKSTVLIGVKSYGNTFFPYCTGVLISSNLVLTAGHCLESRSDVSVWFDRKLPDPQYLLNPKYLIEISRHKNAILTHVDQDLALLKLSRNAPPNYIPVSILMESTEIKKGTLIKVAGYGRSELNMDGFNNLRAAEFRIKDIQDGLFYIDQKSDSGVCHGDSGGPAFFIKNNQLVLAGIIRGGDDEMDLETCKGTSVFTSIPFYKKFILDSVRELEAEFPEFSGP
ncbi:MAG: trypsin-like serine protease [Bacteriovoracaceae bacterium]